MFADRALRALLVIAPLSFAACSADTEPCGAVTCGSGETCCYGCRPEPYCTTFCDCPSQDAGGVDAGGVDAGDVDAGDVDAGSIDAGNGDGGASIDAASIGPDYPRCIARCERGNECASMTVDCAMLCVDIATSTAEERARVALAGCEGELDDLLDCFDRVTCTSESCSPQAITDCVDAFCAANPSEPVCE